MNEILQLQSLWKTSLLPTTATDTMISLIVGDAALNKFTAEFVKDFCFPDGRIDWEKLVRFVSEDVD